MNPDPDPNPPEPLFLIIADHDRRHFCVEGPMTEDGPWKRAAFRACGHEPRVECGPRNPNRRSLAITYQKESGFGGVPPGSIIRPRE